MIRLEARFEGDDKSTLTLAVEAEDWHPDAAVTPWLNAWGQAMGAASTAIAAIPVKAAED
jgi:hypothetical protein